MILSTGGYMSYVNVYGDKIEDLKEINGMKLSAISSILHSGRAFPFHSCTNYLVTTNTSFHHNEPTFSMRHTFCSQMALQFSNSLPLRLGLYHFLT